MNDRDWMKDDFAALDTPPLDAAFAARVGARARAELAPPTRGASVKLRQSNALAGPHAPRLRASRRFELALRAALVPALLAGAAARGTVETAHTVLTIYGAEARR